MKRTTTLAALTLTTALGLAACSDTTEPDTVDPATTAPATATETNTDPAESTTEASDQGVSHSEDSAHNHPADGGQPPADIQEADHPKYPVGSEVILSADHMPGMDGAPATISGAFNTTTYSVSYTPTNGGDPITDHTWVVHEELVEPGPAPLADGTEVVLDAEHMPGMRGAKATIDSLSQETVYMVDISTDEMTMTNHKWVTESEIKPAE